jgi:hypothetical protein
MEEESERFFVEKKQQKTFANCEFWQRRCHNPQEQKFFGSLFQKRTSFFFL